MAADYNLSINLGERWFVSDYQDFFNSLNNLYLILYALNEIKMEKDGMLYAVPLASPRIFVNIGHAVAQILQLDWYIKPEERLQVQKIHHSSPGEIRIDGGGVLREIRELFKDLSYRNEHEKRLGELQIIEKTLIILKDLGIPAGDRSAIISLAYRNIIPLEKLADQGKIGSLIDVYDNEPRESL